MNDVKKQLEGFIQVHRIKREDGLLKAEADFLFEEAEKLGNLFRLDIPSDGLVGKRLKEIKNRMVELSKKSDENKILIDAMTLETKEES